MLLCLISRLACQDDEDRQRPPRKEEKTDEKEKNSDDEPKESWPHYLRRHKWWVTSAVIVTVFLLVALLLWWLHARQYESTDDAFIDTRIVPISAQISGSIGNVAVTDNQLVESGTLLMTIDDQIYQAQLAQAKAQVDQAKANIANLDAQIDAQQARIEQADQQTEQAQAQLAFAKKDFARYQKLAETAAAPLQQASLHQRVKTAGQHVGGDAETLLELIEPAKPVQGIAQDQDAPPFPHTLKAAGDRTRHAVEALVLH